MKHAVLLNLMFTCMVGRIFQFFQYSCQSGLDNPAVYLLGKSLNCYSLSSPFLYKVTASKSEVVTPECRRNTDKKILVFFYGHSPLHPFKFLIQIENRTCNAGSYSISLNILQNFLLSLLYSNFLKYKVLLCMELPIECAKVTCFVKLILDGQTQDITCFV